MSGYYPIALRRSRRKKNCLKFWTRNIWLICYGLEFGILSEEYLKTITLPIAPIDSIPIKKTTSKIQRRRKRTKQPAATVSRRELFSSSSFNRINISTPPINPLLTRNCKFINQQLGSKSKKNNDKKSVIVNDEDIAVPGPSSFYPGYGMKMSSRKSYRQFATKYRKAKEKEFKDDSSTDSAVDQDRGDDARSEASSSASSFDSAKIPLEWKQKFLQEELFRIEKQREANRGICGKDQVIPVPSTSSSFYNSFDQFVETTDTSLNKREDEKVFKDVKKISKNVENDENLATSTNSISRYFYKSERKLPVQAERQVKVEDEGVEKMMNRKRRTRSKSESSENDENYLPVAHRIKREERFAGKCEKSTNVKENLSIRNPNESFTKNSSNHLSSVRRRRYSKNLVTNTSLSGENRRNKNKSAKEANGANSQQSVGREIRQKENSFDGDLCHQIWSDGAREKNLQAQNRLARFRVFHGDQPEHSDLVRSYRERLSEHSEDEDEENESSDNSESDDSNPERSFFLESSWQPASSTPCQSNLNYPNSNSLSIITDLGNVGDMTYSFDTLKKELENIPKSTENWTKSSETLKKDFYNRDFEEIHKLPLCRRIASYDKHSDDDKENHFHKRIEENECKRLTRSRSRSGRCSTLLRSASVSSISNGIDYAKSKNHPEKVTRTSRRNSTYPTEKILSSQELTSSDFDFEECIAEKEKLQLKATTGGRSTSEELQPRKICTSTKFNEKESLRKRKVSWIETKNSLDSERATQLPERFEETHDVRRVTRGLTKINNENFIGKLVWGFCSGWWPALIIDADHVGMLPEPGKLWVYWIGEARISLLNEKTLIESFLCNLESRMTQNSNPTRARAIDATMQMLRTRFKCNLTKPYHTWILNNFTKINGPLDEVKFYPYPASIARRLNNLKEKNAKITEKFLKDQEKEKETAQNQTRKSNDKSKGLMDESNSDEAHLPLQHQNPGVITWAKISGHNWWPAMIIDYRDCCMREPSFGCQWIMWYGDHKLSEIHHRFFFEFGKGFERMIDYVKRSKNLVYLDGVLQASKDYCSRLGSDTEDWTLDHVLQYFATFSNVHVDEKFFTYQESAKVYDKYSSHIAKKLNDLKNSSDTDDDRQDDIENSDDLRAVMKGDAPIEMLCLKCLKMYDNEMDQHPFFQGSLCKDCSDQFKPYMFLFGNDGKCFHCTICACSGMVIICDAQDCPRVFCLACVKHLLCPNTYKNVLEEDPWTCFLCKQNTNTDADMIVKPRLDWRNMLTDMFRTKSCVNKAFVEHSEIKKKIRVLSLFDGLSTGLLVLQKLGFEVEVYYASEIDKDALMVSNMHFGNRVTHLGDVRHISKAKIHEIAPIDLLMGGSPCNDLSLANPARRGLNDPQGTGILFFEYCRIMEILRKVNKGHHLFWLYENVASMPTEYRLEMNKHLGQEPDVIDSADFSPQHRLRLYWHNLPMDANSLSSHGEQDVQDILTPNCQRYSLVKKIRTVTTKVNSLKQGKFALKPILMKNECDSLWITELEEIFGFPRHYTDVRNLSATKRQGLIGKSWSVQTLTAILRSLSPVFLCNTEFKTEVN